MLRLVEDDTAALRSLRRELAVKRFPVVREKNLLVRGENLSVRETNLAVPERNLPVRETNRPVPFTRGQVFIVNLLADGTNVQVDKGNLSVHVLREDVSGANLSVRKENLPADDVCGQVDEGDGEVFSVHDLAFFMDDHANLKFNVENFICKEAKIGKQGFWRKTGQFQPPDGISPEGRLVILELTRE